MTMTNWRAFTTCTVVAVLSLATFTFGQGAQDLPDAAEEGDMAAVRSLLDSGVDVNQAQTNGSTALHWAVYRNDADTVALLIGRGVDVTVRTREEISPLFMATLYGNEQIIQSLLDAGADANEVGPNAETPLMLAGRNGNPEAIRTLIDAGADLNAIEMVRGTTALMWAVEQRHADAVAALIAGGADVAAQSGAAGLPRRYMANRVNTERVIEAQELLREAVGEDLTQAEYQARRDANDTGEQRGFGFDIDTVVTFALEQLPPGGDIDQLLVDFREQAAGFGVGIDFDELEAAIRARVAAEAAGEVSADDRPQGGFGGGGRPGSPGTSTGGRCR
jgi:ankyrin repeat protein